MIARKQENKGLTRFGTYGFLCALLASQATLVSSVSAASKAEIEADRAKVEAKKAARGAKTDIKKGARKMTGNESVVEDVKDDASDAWNNTKDEAEHLKKKHE